MSTDTHQVLHTLSELPDEVAVDAPAGPQINVGMLERYASLGVGVLLVLKLIQHRSLFGLATAAIGAAIINRGLTGHCPLYQDMGVKTTS